MNNPQQKPTARKEGLVIQEMPEEILVFDMETNKAHCLNETAAFVWKACDGNRSVAEITRLFGRETAKPVDEDLIWLAIDQLNENRLLEQNVRANFDGPTRREAIRKIGLAAVVALPIVSSLVAPTAALAVACSGTVISCGNCNDCTACQLGGGGTGKCCSGACIPTGTDCGSSAIC